MDFVELFKYKLDVPKRHMDWRALASKLKIPRNEMDKFGKPKLGPTEHLFIHTRISSSFALLTVGEVKKHIKDMERYDVLKVFENHKLQGNFSTINMIELKTSFFVCMNNLGMFFQDLAI